MDRIFIDVREPVEFAAGHVKGAINIPVNRFVAGPVPELNSVAKDAELILYCASGNRSSMAVRLLKQQGYSNVVNGINQHRVQTTYEVD